MKLVFGKCSNRKADIFLALVLFCFSKQEEFWFKMVFLYLGMKYNLDMINICFHPYKVLYTVPALICTVINS